VCLNLWLTDSYESTIEEMWRVSDLVECLIFIALALMLVYTAFVTARFFRRYFLACRESSSLVPDFTPASQRSNKNLVAELIRGVGTLRSIASAAPLLGLAGTCYGMLCLFSRGYVGRRSGFISEISLEIPVALVATAAGLLVAIPAGISYNVLRSRLEKFESERSNALFEATSRPYGFAQTLPLRKRFSGFPAFALIGAPVLGILIPMFALMLRSPIPMGLPVHLLKIGAGDHDFSPIIISVIATNGSGRPFLYVNSKETSWDELESTIRGQLKVRPRWIVWVEGGDDVSWGYVADVIDVSRGLHAEVVLLTATPRIDSIRWPKRKPEGRRE
jgi:hypothetical protein